MIRLSCHPIDQSSSSCQRPNGPWVAIHPPVNQHSWLEFDHEWRCISYWNYLIFHCHVSLLEGTNVCGEYMKGRSQWGQNLFQVGGLKQTARTRLQNTALPTTKQDGNPKSRGCECSFKMGHFKFFDSEFLVFRANMFWFWTKYRPLEGWGEKLIDSNWPGMVGDMYGWKPQK